MFWIRAEQKHCNGYIHQSSTEVSKFFDTSSDPGTLLDQAMLHRPQHSWTLSAKVVRHFLKIHLLFHKQKLQQDCNFTTAGNYSFMNHTYSTLWTSHTAKVNQMQCSYYAQYFVSFFAPPPHPQNKKTQHSLLLLYFSTNRTKKYFKKQTHKQKTWHPKREKKIQAKHLLAQRWLKFQNTSYNI